MNRGDTAPCEWVFGYGSLMWRPGFPFAVSRRGFIRGFERRFWQASVDHRGTPEAPGRVVTLVASAHARCWGLAFRLPASDRAQVLAALDRRESGGYVREVVTVEFDDGSARGALLYRAAEDNCNYLGPAPIEAVAAQIRGARGPSGANLDYVFDLARTLRDLQIHDPEVHALESCLTATTPGAQT